MGILNKQSPRRRHKIDGAGKNLRRRFVPDGTKRTDDDDDDTEEAHHASIVYFVKA